MNEGTAPGAPERWRPGPGRQLGWHVIVASTVALAVRLLAALPAGMWRDEALFAFVVRMPTWAEMLRWIASSESHPPLYYIVARLWSIPFGTPESAMLALPILTGVALVPVAARVATKIASPSAGVAAAYLTALSPVLVEHSALARPYALLPLLCLLLLASLWVALRTNARKAWVAHIATAVAMLLTHNWAVLVVAASALAGGTACIFLRGQGLPAWRRYLVSYAIIALAYAPWLPFAVSQLRHAGHSPAHSDISVRLIQLFFEGPVEFTFLSVWIAVLTGWIVYRIGRRRASDLGGDALALVLLMGVSLLALSAALVLSSRTNLFLMRCIATIVPCVLVALAVWLGRLAPRRVALLAILVMAPSLARTLAERVPDARPRSNARMVAALIDSRADQTDLVLIAPEFIAPSINYYLRSQNEQIDYPHFGRVGAIPFVDQRERASDPSALARARVALREAHDSGRRVWLIRQSSVPPVDTADLSALRRSGRWDLMGAVRARQLRTDLVRMYGPPAASSAGHAGRGRYETIVAELFTVAASGSD
jgi:hypothetical protein